MNANFPAIKQWLLLSMRGTETSLGLTESQIDRLLLNTKHLSINSPGTNHLHCIVANNSTII